VLDQVRRFLGLLVVGLLLLWLAPAWTRRLADIVEARPLPSLGWGVVSLIGFVVAALVIFIVTIILVFLLAIVTLGDLAGLAAVVGRVGAVALVTAFVVFCGYIVQAAMSYLGGRWILTRLQPERAPNRFLALLLGLVLFVLLTAIPVLGGLIGLLVTLLGLGA